MSEPIWWQRGIVYQVYPRSFQDTNADGVGDLPGILTRLDHLVWLGVDAVWISPIYPSPMADFGYDVADYTDVDPLFGTLADMDRLTEEAHRRGLKLILDFVPNHSSDHHPWFQEARASRKSPKRDWYIWRDPAPDGGPPNNWQSVFGGSAWEWDAATGQYYYHAFLKEQPDLNWRNPQLRAAMYEVLHFWLDRGVDGFRVDVMWHLIKDDQFRDNPPNPDYRPNDPPYLQFRPIYTTDRPEVHEIVAEMRQVIDEYDDRVLIGEIYLPVERLVQYYGEDLRGAHLPFNFQLIEAAWNARQLDQMIHQYEQALPAGGWPNWVLGNHDKPRIASRIGPAQARVAAMLLLTLRGTPTMYYGDEIGMENVPIPPERVQDPYEKNVPGVGVGRDPVRTPMQWDGSAHAGFSTAEPWLPLGPDWQRRNVAVEREEPVSILSLYRTLIDLRRHESTLTLGAWEPVAAEGDVIAYLRRHEDRRLLVALNLGSAPYRLVLPQRVGGGRVLVSTLHRRAGQPTTKEIDLRADEGVIVALE